MTVTALDLQNQGGLLRESAALAWRIAPVFCRSDDGVRASCDWYHGFWPYLRLIGLASSPQRHREFFRDALGHALGTGSGKRIVITGSADYAMLAQVLATLGDSARRCEITAVDACDTPLIVSKWYAKRARQRLTMDAADILRWVPEHAYDVACTHSLISQVPSAQRNQLIAAWRQMLRPGGKVVTTVRINPDWTPERAGFNREQVLAFRAAVNERAQVLVPALDVTSDVLAAAAERYAERIVTHSITSRDELTALFESGGFRLERLDTRTLGGNVGAGLAGPTTSKSGTYAEIVAVRE